MKYGIVGPIAKDYIVLPNGERLEKYGALVYSAHALARLLEGTKDQITCLSHLSQTDFENISSLLQHPNIDLSRLKSFLHQKGTTEIELVYLNEAERKSRQINLMPPIDEEELLSLVDCNSILLMPLNEGDIPLDSVKKLRSVSQATIFLDVHGLVTGVKDNGKRFNKELANAEEWFSSIKPIIP